MTRKKKVVLVQLALQRRRPTRQNTRFDVPLAAGYLKSSAWKQGLLDEYDIEILPRDVSVYGADHVVVQEILKYQPTIVGFSCYCWNGARSQRVAGCVAEHLDVKVVVFGGPEATARDQDFVGVNDRMWVVRGEGEVSFCELLTELLNPIPDPANIRGLTWYDGNCVRRSPPCPYLSDLTGAIPSPYLRGYLSVAEYGLVTEVTRGCPRACLYCNYSKGRHHVVHYEPDQIVEEVDMLGRSGNQWGYLVAPSFGAAPSHEQILEKLGRRKRKVGLQVETYAESADVYTARAMRKAGIVGVEVGLQSVNETSLRAVGRPFHRERHASGVRALLREGISVRAGMIVGLPGDGLEDVWASFRYLQELRVDRIDSFLLQVLPGTRLADLASDLGIQHQHVAPYYVQSTPSLSCQQLQIALYICSKR